MNNLEQLTPEQAKAYGLGPNCKRVVLSVQNVEYAAIAPDDTFWLVKGMEGVKAFAEKFGRA